MPTLDPTPAVFFLGAPSSRGVQFTKFALIPLV